MTSPVDGEPTLVLLVRHAEQTTMLESDPGLTDRGIAQAARVADRLRVLPLRGVIASPMRRAQQTAAPLAAHLGLEVQTVQDLEEVRMSAAEMAEKFEPGSTGGAEPDLGDYAVAAVNSVRLTPTFSWTGAGGGEDNRQFRSRVALALRDLIARFDGGAFVCFTHGGVMNAAMGAWFEVPADMWFTPWHTGISAVLADGERRTLLCVNDAGHLDPEHDLLTVMSRFVEAGRR